MHKIKSKDYLEFKQIYYSTNDYQHQRFGQAFVNKFYPDINNELITKVFYNGDAALKDVSLIETSFIDWSDCDEQSKTSLD